ncbi:GNAT family N-acetyltransferase [Cryobacterium sp. 1639]|uniref:GNAT family N-acetyltransferase n=1 Tax=Cryobacterium inferilacus TaxID=2866629 RepID=UPI001C73B767|nr:GNAT family N-acetyltransferase [Cryobacterium sp. 1639]MBX0298758.1 GNAT family N-acetyltransferase [Cryobacterium sp. 1639]
MTAESDRPIHIRHLEPADLLAVAELRWQWVLENDGTPSVGHAEFLAIFADWAAAHDTSHHCTVVTRGETVIGMAWLATVPRVPSSRAPVRASGDLQCVYVVPTERDSGIGGRMIAAVLAHAFEAGLERVTVQSTPGAVTAYERAGFAASARLLQATRPA